MNKTNNKRLEQIAFRGAQCDAIEAREMARQLMEKDARLTELETVEKTSEARKQGLIRAHKMFQRQRDRAVAAEKRLAEVRGYNLDLAEESRQYQQRIAELEAREVALRQFDEFSICHFGGSEDYAKGYIDAQNNANKAICAAGISIKGE